MEVEDDIAELIFAKRYCEAMQDILLDISNDFIKYLTAKCDGK